MLNLPIVKKYEGLIDYRRLINSGKINPGSIISSHNENRDQYEVMEKSENGLLMLRSRTSNALIDPKDALGTYWFICPTNLIIDVLPQSARVIIRHNSKKLSALGYNPTNKKHKELLKYLRSINETEITEDSDIREGKPPAIFVKLSQLDSGFIALLDRKISEGNTYQAKFIAKFSESKFPSYTSKITWKMLHVKK